MVAYDESTHPLKFHKSMGVNAGKLEPLCGGAVCVCVYVHNFKAKPSLKTADFNFT